MLIQFSVENFLSIKDKVVLSLLASKDNEHPEHLIVDGNKSYLKSAVIYGANASGKSNVLNAFWFMVNYVLTSHNQQLHKTIDRSPFKFDPETPTRPSSFEVIFKPETVKPLKQIMAEMEAKKKLQKEKKKERKMQQETGSDII